MARDADHDEFAKFSIMAIATVVFIASVVFTWSEMQYAIWGESVVAEFKRVSARTTRSRGNPSVVTYHAEYEYVDAKKQRHHHSAVVSSNWQPPTNGKLNIQWLDIGVDGYSRLEGQSQWWAPPLFLGSLCTMVAAGAWIARDYYKHETKVRASRSR